MRILYDDVERYYIERTRIIIILHISHYVFLNIIRRGDDQSTQLYAATHKYIHHHNIHYCYYYYFYYTRSVHDVILHIYNIIRYIWHTHDPNNNNKNRESAITTLWKFKNACENILYICR